MEISKEADMETGQTGSIELNVLLMNKVLLAGFSQCIEQRASEEYRHE